MISSTQKLVLAGIRQFLVSIAILFGVLIFMAVSFQMLLSGSPEMAFVMMLQGPYSATSWLVLLALIAWCPALLALWVFRDARAFQRQGIRTIPVLWALGAFLPTTIIVFPAYYVIREVVWMRRIREGIIYDGTRSPWVRKMIYGVPLREIVFSAAAIVFAAYVIAMAADIPGRLSRPATDAAVAKIHATKLTMDDVMGTHLPPDPGAAANAAIQGIDANHNGIRDDVELAIFKAYPNSARIRMPLLQYALVLQTQMTLPIVNIETVTATVEDNESRSNICLWTLSSRSDMTKFIADMNKYDNFVTGLQLNTAERKQYLHNLFEGNLESYSASNDGCDIDPATLPN
ncbi:hypothetical protein KGO95_04260 [Patescibacteria group bacterium]|nr:hypothetical protein [Patescibacteria group bacterium]